MNNYTNFKTVNKIFVVAVISGECWSGQDEEVTFLRGGESETCVGPDLKQCEPGHPICVGRTKTDYVYRLHALSDVIKKHHSIP